MLQYLRLACFLQLMLKHHLFAVVGSTPIEVLQFRILLTVKTKRENLVLKPLMASLICGFPKCRNRKNTGFPMSVSVFVVLL
jgi:hypothetical protein